jgi:hypothetical protein
LLLVIAVTGALAVYAQTMYRDFYVTFPWSVNDFHTVKYMASLGSIHPGIQTILIIITGFVVLLFVLIFYRDEEGYQELKSR